MGSNNKYKILIVFLLLSGYYTSLQGQEDVPYDHILSVATYYNPSFAGSNGKYSFSNNFKSGDFGPHQSDMYSVYFSFDTYIDAIRGGLGLIGYYNNSAPFEGSSRYLGLIYAPKFNIKNITISPSVKFGYFKNVDKLIVLNNQQDYDTLEVHKKSADLSTGLLVSSGNIYFGFSVDHLLEPRINSNLSYTDFVSLDKKYVAQFGYHFARNENWRSFIHINTLYQNQKNNNFLFVSDYYIGRKIQYPMRNNIYFFRLMLGLGYKLINPTLYDFSKNSVFAGLGVQDNSLTLGIGIEVPTRSYKSQIIESSIKYTLNYR